MKDEKIKIGDSVENLTEEERKKIRMSFDPDKMGFEVEEEGTKDED
jgi:hypothetical protein